MYRLSKLVLHNICQYSDFSLDIDLGLLAICGKNGAGKTTLLRGLVYGLTGLVDGSWGTQKLLQKDGTADPGYVDVTLSGSDHTLQIRRFTASNTKFPDVVIRHSGDTEDVMASNRKEVDRFLETVYGISCSLLFQICWGRQGQMDMLLTAPSAYVNTFLTSVFDLKYLENLRDKLKKQSDTIAQLPVVTDDDVKTIADSLEKCREEKKAYETDLKDTEDTMQSMQTALEGLQTRLNGAIPKDEYTQREHSLKTALTGLKNDLKESGTEPTVDFRNVAAELDIPEDNLEGFLDTFKNNTMVEVADNLKKIQTDIDNKKRVRDMLKKDIAEKEKDYAEKLEKLSVPDTVCTLCNGTIVDHERYERERCYMLTAFKDINEYKKACNEIIQKSKELYNATETEIVNLEDKKKELVACDKKFNQWLPVFQTAVEQYRAHKIWKNNKKFYDLVQARIAEKEALLKELETKAVATDEDSVALKESLSAIEQKRRDHRDLINKFAEEKGRLVILEKEFEDAKIACNNYKMNNLAKNAFDILRDVLSQNKTQARYLDARIDELNQIIATTLQQTGMPFSLFLNKSTHVFEYTTQEGYTHPATHLSGAQKNISAVILQMAVLEVIQPQINLFLVDEPSESLDVENTVIMTSLFQNMNRLLPTIEGVMLIVSRDEQLIDNCENTLNVTGLT